MNAIDLLKKDHRAMEKLLDRLDATSTAGPEEREKLFATIKKEIEAHEAIEEEILYPALKQHPKAKEIVLEGYEEHHVVDLLLGEIEDPPTTRPGGPRPR